MTIDYKTAIEKKNEASNIRNSAIEDLGILVVDETVRKMSVAEYNRGYWDGIIAVMKDHKLTEVTL